MTSDISTEESKCIFCGIVNGKSTSIKIDENEQAIAVLDINPISKGHTLVIPKNHDEEPGKEVQEFVDDQVERAPTEHDEMQWRLISLGNKKTKE